MKKKLKSLKPKWVLCALLALAGLGMIFLLPGGYDMSGLCLLGLAALIPIYHWLRSRKRLKLLFSAMLFLLILSMVLTLIPIVRASRGTEEPTSPYLIVLGAGVNGTTPSLSLRERINAAYDYLTAHPQVTAIVSGGQGSGEDITEAQCMQRELTAMGIDPARIWLEERSTSTLENLKYSLALIQEKTGTVPASAVVISSEYHLYRTSMIAGWLGLEAELVPAKTTYIAIRVNYYLREIFAVWYYSILGG